MTKEDHIKLVDVSNQFCIDLAIAAAKALSQLRPEVRLEGNVLLTG